MKELPITPGDVLMFASIAAVVFTLTAGLGKWFMGYLSLKFGPKTPQSRMEDSARMMAEQSQQCRFDHDSINKLIATQQKNIEQLLQQNGEQLRALAEANHNAQLRHQIMLAEFKDVKHDVQSVRQILEKSK